MFARSAGNFMTKATAFVATLFIICSLSLTILSRGDAPENNSVLDKIEENTDAPGIDQKETLIKISREESLKQNERVELKK